MKLKRGKQSAELPPEKGARNAAFYLFCGFIVSYFVHLTARVSWLGAIHFDLAVGGEHRARDCICSEESSTRRGRKDRPGVPAVVDFAGVHCGHNSLCGVAWKRVA